MTEDIVNRLREPLSMSMFRNSSDLFAEVTAQRQEAADHIEALEAEVVRYQQLLDAAIDDYNDARNAALEEAARLLDAEDDRLKKIWEDFVASGHKGPASSNHGIPAKYAEMIRSLKGDADA